MLTRMIPTGLTEYLKHAAITEEHRKNLDEMEEEFYATFGNAKVSTKAKSGASELQMRMRKRIAAALKEHSIDRVQYAATNATSDTEAAPSTPLTRESGGEKKSPENYRIMFHVMTQDHKLPDLIWNEQTRLELRNVLEYEIKEFEREQRLRGLGMLRFKCSQF
jgi:phosphatidylserine/phosphatidylglycerophosphate/cardiolipin synthase-like enzyme